MSHTSKTARQGAISLCTVIALVNAAPASAFPMQDAVAAAGTPAAAPQNAPAAQPADKAEDLRAVFIDVSGKVQWRAAKGADGKDQAWKDAEVNDVVQAGVEIRTGTRSRATLRVGRNATVLIDSATSLTLPTVMQEGEILRTVASIRNGRADFKVDKVGMTNDFRVVTPSTTLAVRGTELAVVTGALKQTEIVGARTNVINAIELKYALTNQIIQLSGDEKSSNDTQNPAHVAMVKTAAPTVDDSANDGKGDKVTNAVIGPPPSTGGSTAGLIQNNKSNSRTQQEQSSEGGSVNATIRRAVELAIQRTEQAIDYMMHAREVSDLAASQADALGALQQLANARKAEALAALAAHQAAVNTAQCRTNEANSQNGQFNCSNNQLNSYLSQFNNAADSANSVLAGIQSILDNGGKGDLHGMAEQAAGALAGMNDALNGAHDSLSDMSGRLEAVDTLLKSMDLSTLPDAAAARSSYLAAMAQLAQLAGQGASAAQIAAAARDAVAQLQTLVADLAVLAPTDGALNAAAQALQALADSNQALANSQAALASIQAALAAAGNDPAASQLGMVEQLYAQIVAVRAMMASQLLASAGLIDAADGTAGTTNAYASNVFQALNEYWRDQCGNGRALAQDGAAEAAAAAGNADLAMAQYTQAVDGAQGILSQVSAFESSLSEARGNVGSARANLDGAASQAMAALDNVAQTNGGGVMDALAALDALEQALCSVVSQFGSFQSAEQNSPQVCALNALQAQGAAALNALMAALAQAQNGAGSAQNGSDAAQAAAAAAAQVRDLALNLAQQYGLSMDGALAAAAQAQAEALQAGAANGQAQGSLSHVEALALLAQAGQLDSIAAQIQALLGSSDNLSSAAAADLAAAQAAYVQVNEHGTVVFSQLTVNASNDAANAQMNASASFGALQQMATVSTQYVAALDGAESAANNAERAATSANLEMQRAVTNDAQATTAYQQLQIAIRQGDQGSAQALAGETNFRAQVADGAANRSADFAGEASNHYSTAVQYGAVAQGLQGQVEAFGSTPEAFAAQAAQYAGDVANADSEMTQIRQRADFYNDVAQMLSGRAGTGAAASAASTSSDAHAQVMAIAAQLSAAARDAAQMEQTAGSNAQRMFYRSARLYVERAGAAAQQALRDAEVARNAADHAIDLGQTANDQVNGMGQGGAAALTNSPAVQDLQPSNPGRRGDRFGANRRRGG